MDSSSQATGSDSCANVARTLQNSPLFQATGEIFSRLVARGHHVAEKHATAIRPATAVFADLGEFDGIALTDDVLGVFRGFAIPETDLTSLGAWATMPMVQIPNVKETIESRFPVALAHRSRVSMKLLVSSGPVLLLCGTEIIV